MADSLGFVNLGRSYGKSADFLCEAVTTKKISIGRSHPIDFLYSHTFELMLKGCLLEENPSQAIEDYGHDLLCLYDDIKSQKLLNNLIGVVETKAKECWKRYLREARECYAKKLGRFAQFEGLGVHDNSGIGKELPELRRQIKWLSERHKEKGGKLRYLQIEWGTREQINAFGLSDDVVWRSSGWAYETIYECFQEHRRSQNSKQWKLR